jgi:hypothetical protein
MGVVKKRGNMDSFLHKSDLEMTRGDRLVADHPFFDGGKR